ncbi:MBL fold metallo-hydrolase [Roseomonas sp. BN140053]|uniref:MBL fold metallo-hydrolase n=1 Tax=Roseomonas sp. BN140053 TaxID=3391898 RepID=UPI0039EC6462
MDLAAPSPSSRRFGRYTVTTLLDGVMALPVALLSEVEGRDALLRAAGLDPAGTVPTAVNAFALQDGEALSLIDAGLGPIRGPEMGQAVPAMRAAGLDPAQVSAVVMTHLHTDHAAGLLDAEGRAAFPAARLLVPAEEARFWRELARTGELPRAPERMIRVACDVMEIYADRLSLFEAGEEPLPGLRAEALPGHTPGHTGFRIGAGPDGLLIWGDITHCPVLQVPLPRTSIGFDVDPELAAATRMRCLAEVAAEGITVAGCHLGHGGFARVEADGAGSWRILPLS